MTETQQPSSRKSLKDRSRIPPSFYITVIGYTGICYFGNVFRVETITSWVASVRFACEKLYQSLVDSQELAQTLLTGEYQPVSAYLRVSFVYISVFSLIYIFFVAPFRAGFWTGSRSGRHMIHRYMGLAYLAQYFLAWFEFTSKYDDASPTTSYMPMFIALNGMSYTTPRCLVIIWFWQTILIVSHQKYTHTNRCHTRMVRIFLFQSVARTIRCWILFKQGCPFAIICA